MFIQPIPSPCGSVHAVRVGDVQPAVNWVSAAQPGVLVALLRLLVALRQPAATRKICFESAKGRQFFKTPEQSLKYVSPSPLPAWLSFAVNRLLGETVTC